VLPASTGGVPGRRRARRVEAGLTEAVGRQWGSGKRPARRCSAAAGSSGGRQRAGRGPAALVWKGEERFSFNSGSGEARRALTREGEDCGGARQNPT
jgi:hypothetical protein